MSVTAPVNLLANGAQPKDVQELLGHSNVSTTMNVYAHATREAKTRNGKVVAKLSNRFQDRVDMAKSL